MEYNLATSLALFALYFNCIRSYKKKNKSCETSIICTPIEMGISPHPIRGTSAFCVSLKYTTIGINFDWNANVVYVFISNRFVCYLLGFLCKCDALPIIAVSEGITTIYILAIHTFGSFCNAESAKLQKWISLFAKQITLHTYADTDKNTHSLTVRYQYNTRTSYTNMPNTCSLIYKANAGSTTCSRVCDRKANAPHQADNSYNCKV